MIQRYLPLIVLFSIFVGSVLVAEPTFIPLLYQKKSIDQIKLLQDSPLFKGQMSKQQATLKELFSLKNYQKYITRFDQRFNLVSDADNELRYYYLVSLFSVKKFDLIGPVIENIDSSNLNQEQFTNYSIIKAVYLYKVNKYQELQSLYSSLSPTGDIPDASYQAIEDLRNLLYLVLNKSTNFVRTGGSFSYVLGWNNLITGNYQEAFNRFQEANLPTSDSLLTYSNAMVLMKNGQYKLAEPMFAQLGTDPEFGKDSLFRQVEIQNLNGNSEKALDTIKQFRTTYPNDTIYVDQLLIEEGSAFYSLKKLEKAKSIFVKIVGIYPQAAYYLAEINYRDRQYKKAAVYYQQVMLQFSKDHPLYLSSKYGYAWCLFKQGKYSTAKKQFQAIQQSSNSEPIILNCSIKLADCNYNLHYFDAAQAEYNNVISKLTPKKDEYSILYKQSLLNMSKILTRLRKYKKANEYLDFYLDNTELDNERYAALRMQADNYIKALDYQNATKILDQVVALYGSKDEDVYIALGDTYFNMKEYGKSLVVYQEYLGVFLKGDRRMDAQYGIVQSYFKLKDYEHALLEAKKTDKEFNTSLTKELQEKIKFAKEQES